MYIAIVDFYVSPENRDAALSALLTEVATVHAMDGCKTFRPYIDPQSETHVGVLHEWETQDGFNGYLASDMFAKAGATLRPMMTGAPSSRRYTAELIEDVA